MKARNGQIIAIGQAYKNKENCLKGIESVKQNAPIAEIIELEGKVEVEEPEIAHT